MENTAKESKFYPKTDTLLVSMALRNDHGFGMYDKEEQDKILAKMDKLYDAYVAGKTDKQISEELNLYIVTVSQVREEVDGTGFFQPTEESKAFYKNFRKE
jgi:DNA-binding NarL/FixJ family response regulator